MLLPMTIEDIRKEVLRLPPEARASLVGDILESLDDERVDQEEVDAAWADEIERRLRDLDEGRTKAVPSSQVREELHAIVNKARGR
jgi:putative addiction module component (TIGR02574 family)